MSYHIYNTKGLILSERPLKEADRIYSVLTHDLGLVQATALGVRKEGSKLRGCMEPFSLAKLSLVRGKEFWRLTSAELIQSIPNTTPIARALNLLEKLVQGESAHPELFDVVESAILKQNKDNEIFEIDLVASMLFHLGYLKESDLTLEKPGIVRAINDGIHQSQLA